MVTCAPFASFGCTSDNGTSTPSCALAFKLLTTYLDGVISPCAPILRSENDLSAGRYAYMPDGTTQLDSLMVAPGTRGSLKASSICPSNGSATSSTLFVPVGMRSSCE